jgi:predicted DNA-binding protein with PD1-like motif
MIYREARFERALRARLEPGEDLAWALRELARWEKLDAALIRGSGALRWADLAPGDGPAAERLQGPLVVPSLSGTLALRDGALEVALHAVVVWGSGETQVVRAGRLDAAVADGLDLVLDVLDDRGLEWRIDPATGAHGRRS